MTQNRHKHAPTSNRGSDSRSSRDGGARRGDDDEDLSGGRHVAAIATLEAAIEPLVEDLGYELLLLEWTGSGKRRLLRLYIDSPTGVTVEDCTRLGRILSNGLDAREAQAATGEGEALDPVLAALLGKPYVLEVSSPGVDRPLTRRRHFAAQVGNKAKIETFAPLEPGANEKKFYGRIVSVEGPDPEASEGSVPDDTDNQRLGDQRRGVVVLHDPDGDRTLRIPLPRIRRANLVWEG